jgi:hypothetical protein
MVNLFRPNVVKVIGFSSFVKELASKIDFRILKFFSLALMQERYLKQNKIK